MHPELSFDLLGEMIHACHEIGVKAPLYISAGLDEKMARKHPEWLIRHKDESLSCFGVLSNNFMEPGYHEFCFNSPYLDYLLQQIEEILNNYPCDGLWLDIVGERRCYCQNCVQSLLAEGKDPRNEEDVIQLSKRTFANYVSRVKALVEKKSNRAHLFFIIVGISIGEGMICYRQVHMQRLNRCQLVDGAMKTIPLQQDIYIIKSSSSLA